MYLLMWCLVIINCYMYNMFETVSFSKVFYYSKRFNRQMVKTKSYMTYNWTQYLNSLHEIKLYKMYNHCGKIHLYTNLTYRTFCFTHFRFAFLQIWHVWFVSNILLYHLVSCVNFKIILKCNFRIKLNILKNFCKDFC